MAVIDLFISVSEVHPWIVHHPEIQLEPRFSGLSCVIYADISFTEESRFDQFGKSHRSYAVAERKAKVDGKKEARHRSFLARASPLLSVAKVFVRQLRNS